ncbi:MAG TPA: V-type ATP synthase subunit F [Candidatus Bilamarchaeaceae archaeon]|nr:V-type ATP synthase subunit F [Candidatus Bilamarchaeaceae archaeon]
MKAKLAVLGDAHLAQGFQLAGVENVLLTDESGFATELERMLGQPEYGILVVQEKWLKNIPWPLKKRLEHIAYPVIIPLPARGDKSAQADEIQYLIKRALGFDVGKK